MSACRTINTNRAVANMRDPKHKRDIDTGEVGVPFLPSPTEWAVIQAVRPPTDWPVNVWPISLPIKEMADKGKRLMHRIAVWWKKIV